MIICGRPDRTFTVTTVSGNLKLVFFSQIPILCSLLANHLTKKAPSEEFGAVPKFQSAFSFFREMFSWDIKYKISEKFDRVMRTH